MYNNKTEYEYISMDNRRKYEYTPKPYSIQTIVAEPGDIILAHVSEDLDLDTVNDIWNQLKIVFPNNDVLIANEHILKGLTIIKPAIGTVNTHQIKTNSLEKWLRENVEYTL